MDMDMHTHMVLWANSVKGHVQKCHESWGRFSPYSLISVYILQPINIPVSRVLFSFTVHLEKDATGVFHAGSRGIMLFICYYLVFVLTSILLIFLVQSSCLE